MLFFLPHSVWRSTGSQVQETDSPASDRDQKHPSLDLSTLRNHLHSPIAELTIAEKLEQCGHSLDISRSSVNISAAIEKTSNLLAILRSVIPRAFKSNYRNPCWDNDKFSSTSVGMLSRLLYDAKNNLSAVSDRVDRAYKTLFKHQRRSNVQCLPYFYIIGFPKCGTTSLHKALSQHSDTATPLTKEPQFWNNHARYYTDENLSHPNSIKLSLLKYLHTFRDVGRSRRKIAYDPTAFTVVDGSIFEDLQDFCTTPALISTLTPNARIIVLMREPVDRLFSNYLFACTQRYGLNATKWPLVMQRPDENFHREVLATLNSFKRCLANLSLVECVNINRFVDKGLLCGKVGLRLTISLYYAHLVKWLLYFPRENFLFLRTEDLSSHSYEVLAKVTDFLSISPVNATTAAAWFDSPRNVQTKVMHSSDNFSVLPETRRILDEFYAPYNTMLAEITGDEHFLWEQ